MNEKEAYKFLGFLAILQLILAATFIPLIYNDYILYSGMVLAAMTIVAIVAFIGVVLTRKDGEEK